MADAFLSKMTRLFEAGEVLFREGEVGDVMFVIQSGAVRITKDLAGDDRVLAILGPGEFLGEMAILNGKPRSATATTVEPTRCLVIESRTLETMVARNSEIAMRLIKKLARRLDSADSLVEVLTHRDPKARVMLALARHADAFGEATAEGIRIRASAEDIASEVATEPAVAHDVMTKLRRLRLAFESDGGILVTDVARLHEFVEFLEMPKHFGE